MVSKKKIYCLIMAAIIIFAVCAPCAIGVGAVYDVTSYSLGQSNSSASGVGSSLPVSFTTINSSYEFIRFSCALSDRDHFSQGNTYIFSLQFSTSVPISYTSNSYVEAYFRSNYRPTLTFVNFNTLPTATNSYSLVLSLDFTFGTPQNFPTLRFFNIFPQQSDLVIVWDSFSDTLPPPPSDDEEFSQAVASEYYFTKAVSLSSSYLPLWTFSEFPSTTDSSWVVSPSNYLKGFFGADLDYSDILTFHTVIQGSATFVSVSSNGFSSLSLSPSFQILLSNLTDPTDSNFLSIDITSLGLDTSPIISYWEYPLNNFVSRYSVSFYMILDGALLSSSALSDYHYIDFIFESNVQRGTSIYFTPQSFELQYFHRASSTSLIPDNPYDNDIPEEGNEYYLEYDAEYNFLQGMFPTAELDLIDDAVENIQTLLPITTWSTIAQDLYANLSYSGTDFSFILPSAAIPFPDYAHRLTLWSDTEIPFGYYMDSIPYVYRVIIGFLVLAGGSSCACFFIMNEIKRTFSGDISIRS